MHTPPVSLPPAPRPAAESEPRPGLAPVLAAAAQAARGPEDGPTDGAAARGVPLDAQPHAALLAAMAALEDPAAQPALPYDAMIFTADPQDYVFSHVAGAPLARAPGGAHFSDVHFNLSADGALAALLAALAASCPDLCARLFEGSAAPYEVRLHAPGQALPAAYRPLRVAVDGAVPRRGGGQALGSPPGQQDPLWPLLVAKAVLKLNALLRRSSARPLQLGTWDHLAGLVSGSAAGLWPLRGSEAQRVDALVQMGERLRQAPAALTFRDPPESVRTYVGGRVRPALGGLGTHVDGVDADVLLLARHHYAVLALEPGPEPRLLLYNALGYNPDSQALLREGRDLNGVTGRFFLPERLPTLPRAPGCFWLPLRWAARLGICISTASLPPG